MDNRKKRICKFCGNETAEEYTDEEWEVAGQECEECHLADLINGSFDE